MDRISPNVEAEDIRVQVNRIIGSPEFEKSLRLQEFLNHIAEECLSGRARNIKGFTIGQAVFGADEDFDPETNSIVRIEAGRLRQRLAEYYTTSGRDDPIVVDIPKGSYVPRFSLNPQAPQQNNATLSDHRLKLTFRNRWLAAGGLVLAAILALSWRNYGALEHFAAGDMNRVDTQNLSGDSEAQILFRQAFVLLMPPEDETRLATSQELFQRVIEIDSTFSGGYAGKSIALSFQGLFR
jgi:hypothetical protein